MDMHGLWKYSETKVQEHKMSRKRQWRRIKLENCPGYQAVSPQPWGYLRPTRQVWMRQVRNAERGEGPSHLKSILHADAIQRKRAWRTVLLDSGRKVYETPRDHVSTRTSVVWPPPPCATQESYPATLARTVGQFLNFVYLHIFTVHPGWVSAPLCLPCWHLKHCWIDPAGSLLMGEH